MDSNSFRELISELSVGKITPQAIYVHRSTIQNTQLLDFINRIQSALKQSSFQWEIAKFSKQSFQFSLLSYPDFDSEAYPELKTSMFVDLTKKHHRMNDYSKTDNPPILHRKELMVTTNYPLYEEFTLITQEGELAGLYENTRAIGFKLGWEATITNAGYELVDGRLFRASALAYSNEKKIDRHKTAIVRHGLSTPMKFLFNKGYLNGNFSVFDYGCGLGDDLAELHANGIDASGWDPNFRPDAELFNADIVNLGFVLNVIEDVPERIEALHNAYQLADLFLIVSCMLISESKLAQMTQFKDGVITSRNTFQKYYFQTELQLFLEDSLEKTAISAGPGIFIIFKDELEEQNYLSAKLKRKRQWTSLNKSPTKSQKTSLLLEQNHELVEAFWNTVLELGRIPAADEFAEASLLVELFGSTKKLFNLLMNAERKLEFEQAKAARREDYLVYFALGFFSKRKTYRSMPEGKKRDIKALFVNVNLAQEEAKEWLFKIADYELLERAVEQANQYIPAIYNAGHSMLVQTRYINELPIILRVYIGAAAMIYGDWNEADVVKIHITSGKVTFMVYDDFAHNSIPRIKERIKVKLAEQDIDYFDYINEAKRPPLLNKHELMAEFDDNYKNQKRLDEKLIKLGVVNGKGEQHMSNAEFNNRLVKNNKIIRNFRVYSTDKVTNT
ncbi:DNA phosphorothioation-associated putative methyltransferase [Aliiglaciecola sp. 3_MG-2023]|uniref:DNA phosphorothioation-associated putative methyltransferase n=1 Tax=Aliiglaciecola sp. 3_MG-2023 TaxID=3062644 RepID=UPI0026E22D8C|nr:DNA phosphorothioation-associated putative methyltransferase [Aliiglaciecola sp. 3_MG-2023]MDO6694538.1 DNA phosphorothioation-associated putative methyltransferase [Aliiglaciecola sp. 3_MG-2023]